MAVGENYGGVLSEVRREPMKRNRNALSATTIDWHHGTRIYDNLRSRRIQDLQRSRKLARELTNACQVMSADH